MSDGDERAEEDFDDNTVQTSITVGFALADGSEPDSNMWIYSPDNIDDGSREFLNIPFVQSLIDSPAAMVSIHVDHCG